MLFRSFIPVHLILPDGAKLLYFLALLAIMGEVVFANIPTEIQVRSCRIGDVVVIAMLNSLTSKHNCWKGSGGGRFLCFWLAAL